VLQTGLRVSDIALSRSSTAGQLFEHFWTPPVPTKLADRLILDNVLPSFPNVKVVPKKVSGIDKQKAVGRWKVIEQELLDRGLPVVWGKQV
jgi:hypothetical protein